MKLAQYLMKNLHKQNNKFYQVLEAGHQIQKKMVPDTMLAAQVKS